jgi:hypothetical protein
MHLACHTKIQKGNTLSKFKLIIKADTNDANYIQSVQDITQEELNALLPIFEAIKNFKPYITKGTGQSELEWTHDHNWPGDGEYCPRTDLGEKYPAEIYAGILTEDQVELFNEYRPYGGECDVHSIVKITVLEYIDEKEYL